MKRVFLLFVVIAFSCISQELYAQKVAVKTNLLSDVVLSPNLGIEVGLAPKWTMGVTGQFNAWNMSHDRRWKHWLYNPKCAIGYATVLVRIFLDFTCMAVNTTSVE